MAEFVTSKSDHEFFPDSLPKIVAIGCGATGGAVIKELARLGVTNIVCYDADVVETKNLNNQTYYQNDVGIPKVKALWKQLCNINPQFNDLEDNFRVQFFDSKTTGEILKEDCIVLMLLDKGRREVFKYIKISKCIHVIETRIGASDCIIHSIPKKHFKLFEDNLPTREQEDNPDSSELSPCGDTISVISTVNICAGFANQALRALSRGEEYPYRLDIGCYPKPFLFETIIK